MELPARVSGLILNAASMRRVTHVGDFLHGAFAVDVVEGGGFGGLSGDHDAAGGAGAGEGDSYRGEDLAAEELGESFGRAGPGDFRGVVAEVGQEGGCWAGPVGVKGG